MTAANRGQQGLTPSYERQLYGRLWTPDGDSHVEKTTDVYAIIHATADVKWQPWPSKEELDLYELIADGQVEVVHIGRSARIPTDAITTLVNHLRTDQAVDDGS